MSQLILRGEGGEEWLGGPLLDAVWGTVWPASGAIHEERCHEL